MTSEFARQARLLRSREEVPTSGLYLAESHFHEGFRPEVLLSAGDRLPNCPNCGEEIFWKYVGRYGRSVIDKEELARRAELSTEPHGHGAGPSPPASERTGAEPAVPAWKSR